MEDSSEAAVIAASLAVPARFGAIFDRHATVLHRYLVRRLGPDEAESMVGEVFRDELAAVDYLTRVFQFTEHRAARMEFDGKYLCWPRVGTGVVMIGRANAEVHYIHSPLEAGLTTVMMNVYVHDIDAHYAHAVAAGANVTMDLADAFFGERRYEATDPEGHRWHFGERFDDILARGGRVPEPLGTD